MEKDKIYDLHVKTPLEVKLRRSKNKVDEFIYKFGHDGVFCLISGSVESLVLHDLLVKWGHKNIDFVFVNVPSSLAPLKRYIKLIIPNVIILHDMSLADYKKRFDKKPILPTIDNVEIWSNNSCVTYKNYPTARPLLTWTYDDILSVGGVKFENDIKNIQKTSKKVLQNPKRCDII